MCSRAVLYFSPDNNYLDLYKQLSFVGWELYQAEDVSHANSLIKDLDFKVGIVDIDESYTNAIFNDLAKLFCRNNQIRWILVVSASQLHESCFSKQLRELIINFSYDYHTKPIDFRRLLTTIGHAYGLSDMIKQSKKTVMSYKGQHGMVGSSLAMRDVYRSIDKVSSEEQPVFITGETGVGKELVAKAIHKNSTRANKPFVAVNCGALSRELIQSELFGHEKGAFTGAHKQKIGKIEMAQGGTLFLDEIGDFPLNLQVNLLRFMQDKRISRVGSTEEFKLDIRVITATHVDLQKAMKKKLFREDLFYRLNVLEISIPPLNKRENDIEELAWYFFHEYAAQQNYKVEGFSNECLNTIKSYNWEGNVRELSHRVKRAVVMSENYLITPADMGIERRDFPLRELFSLEESRIEAEKTAIINALHYTGGNKNSAAKLLGVSRGTLYRLIEKHSLIYKCVL